MGDQLDKFAALAPAGRPAASENRLRDQLTGR